MYTFRSQMSREQWQEALPLLAKHLSSPNYVIHTYCAIALERALFLTDESNAPVIPRATTLPLSKDMLRQLFLLMQKDANPAKVQENEFLMRCVMRILVVCREDGGPNYDLVIPALTSITNVIRHNPSNPRFYYYMFESYGAVIRFGAPADPVGYDQKLFSPLAEILQQNVSEFIPYAFQLFAALVEANTSGTLPASYIDIIGPCLQPFLWQERGNVPALTRLLCAFISRGAQVLVDKRHLEPTLGIFQLLLSSKAHESHAFDLLESIITYFPPPSLQQYYPQIISLLLTRLQSSRTDTFIIRFARLYHFMCTSEKQRLSTDAVVALFEGVQSGIFGQVYLNYILSTTVERFVRPFDRKLAIISLTKSLTDSKAFADKYPKGWGHTCGGLLKLMKDPPRPPPRGEGEIVDQDADDISFGVGFTQLSTCKRPAQEPFPEITDLKQWMAQTMKAADEKSGGKLNEYVHQRLDEEQREHLVSYMN